MGDQEIIEKLRKVSLAEIASSLGLPIQMRGNRPWTNCLFHQDRKPSMALHQLPSGDWRFKCFSCGANGDAFDLVQKVDACDFRTALENVASVAGIALPKRRKGSSEQQDGIELALRYYGQQAAEESRRLKEWSTERRFRLATLKAFSVTYASNQKLSTTVSDREEVAALRDAQLIFRPRTERSQQPELDLDVPDRDAMIGNRIIFPVRGFHGGVEGYFGRATDPETQPRYQFTRNFPKRRTLFGIDVARKCMKKEVSDGEDIETPIPLQVYLVEGATDVLRLHQLGLNALAVMGSDLSLDQAKLVTGLARDLGSESASLTVRLFFDGDDAGQAATRNALTKLLPLEAEQALLGIEVVVPNDDEHPYQGSDPDAWLVEANKRNIRKKLNDSIVSVGTFLTAYGLRCEINEIESRWHRSATTQRYAALRRIDNLLPKKVWKGVFESIGNDLFNTTESQIADATGWQIRVTEYLRRSGTETASTPNSDIRNSEHEATKIAHAIQIARCFSQRREFPVDAGSWERILGGLNVTTPYLLGLLDQGEEACSVEPLLGMYVPKQSGDRRLKAIPCPEQLAIQHYLLNELLGGSARSTDFEDCIPAVRNDGGILRTTGLRDLMTVPAVCFSYQVDMEIVRNEKPPGNEGIFRPYRECWSDFVEYLSKKVQADDNHLLDDRPFYVARLDVRAYYDTVTRVCVNRILFDPLLEAIKSLDKPTQFAPSFRPIAREATERAREFIDLLCQQSFGYPYVDPNSGKEKRFKDGASVGMPQGPSLSAYLGSIALFDLDEAIQTAIEEDECGVAYARYVDDMVVITRSKPSLDQIRSLVQKQLGLIGLELSHKVEPLPPMNAVQVQNWLTANRGLAAVSGVTQTPPIVGAPLGDDGCVDRRSVLVRLHNHALLNPNTNPSAVRNVIQGVLRCPEVRFGDQCHTSELIWRLLADEMVEQQIAESESDAIAARYIEVWRDSSDQESLSQLEDKWMVLASIHGLDRFLSKRTFRSTMFDDEQQARSFAWRGAIARSVLAGLVENLIQVLPEDGESLNHILGVHELNLFNRAVSVTESFDPQYLIGRVNQITKSNFCSTNITRHIVSLAGFQQSGNVIDSLSSVSFGQTDEHLLFHEAVSRLSRHSEQNAPDPMLAMESSIKDVYSQNPSSQMAATLKSWLPKDGADIDIELAIRSLSVFLNVTQQAKGRLLNNRQALLKSALKFSGEDDVVWLPCLPIEHIDGFVGRSDSRFLAVSVSGFNEEENDDPHRNSAELLPKVDWEIVDSGHQPNFHRADAKTFEPLPERLDDWTDRPDLPSWIADSFENLLELSSNGIECPPVVQNLLTGKSKGTRSSDTLPVTAVLGYSVPSRHFDAQAFVRSSNQQLIPKTVYANGARYWRAGIAITDALDLLDDVFYDPLKSVGRPSHSANLNDSEADHRWAREKLIRFSLQRLCGITTNSSYVLEESGVPKSLQRVLERLRRFPMPNTEGAESREVAAVLAAVFETRFAAARFSEDREQAWEQKSGAAVSVLADIARRVVYTDKQLAARLPPAKIETVVQRRNVCAWISLAARIHRLYELIDEESDAIQTPLLGLSHGLAFSGLGALLRCLALETIAAEDGLRERIASLNPSSVSLASWHLDGFELLTFDRLRFDAEDSTNTELEKLLATLKRGLADDNSNQAKTLEKITPLGWAVVLGVASGHLKSDLKLSFLQAERMDRKLGEVFQVVVELLKPAARGVEDGEDADDPWYGLACVLDENTFEAVIQVISRLEDFGESTGLVVSCLHTSPRFRMEPAEHDSNPLESTRRTWDVKFDDSVYELEAWRIASASTANEPQNVPAENVRIEDDRGNMRTHYSWTETRVGGRLIGVHLTKPGLADLAGFQMPSLDKIEPSEDVPEAADKNFSPAERSDENGSTPIEQSTETISSADESPQSSGTGYSSPTSASFVSKSKASGWSALTDYQTRSWNDRGDREGSHYKRIAFIQWQVEEYGS